MSPSRFEIIEACVFDAYGTLFDVNSAVASLRDRVGPQHGALSAAWRVRQLEYTWLRSLMKSHVDFWQLTADALWVSLREFSLDRENLHEELMQAYLHLAAFPEVRRVLALLRQAGLRCAILTNGSPMMIESAVANAGIGDYIEQQLSVESVGIYKPDARVYQLAVDRLGVSAERIAFLSSNAWDAAGAAHFGFAVAWVNRYSQPPERLPGTPAASLSTLDELPPLLGIC
ncbi:MAG: haloacid dehalogenase type II [Granulosicoccus sp.]|nr:haloacid dehalogenase type II [Granulosicoccus sp.]